LISLLGDKYKDLVAEGNYYHDISHCGIGAHGDSERNIVIGVRLGASMNLQYRWHYCNQGVGNIFEIILNQGDIYFMSSKAVGRDWKKQKIYTLRHAAGAKKYLF
jgi:hypothetical protein